MQERAQKRKLKVENLQGQNLKFPFAAFNINVTSRTRLF
jgi:hypothetical protein